ncbi:hypothetical protein ACWEQN_36130 [Streptomyces sp. NPDC004129]
MGAGAAEKPLSAPAGFPTLSRQPASAPAVRRGARPAGEVADLDTARARRREQQERLEVPGSRPRKPSKSSTTARAAVQEEQSRAEEEQAQAEQRVTDLSRQLEDAEREQQRARDSARKAHDHTRDADRAVREARRRAMDAGAHARKLAEQAQHQL